MYYNYNLRTYTLMKLLHYHNDVLFTTQKIKNKKYHHTNNNTIILHDRSPLHKVEVNQITNNDTWHLPTWFDVSIYVKDIKETVKSSIYTESSTPTYKGMNFSSGFPRVCIQSTQRYNTLYIKINWFFVYVSSICTN